MAALFHSLVRDSDSRFDDKGFHPLTENYSVFRPEVTVLDGEPLGSFNLDLYSALMKHDRIYVCGQAKSHCVLSTLNDVYSRIVETPYLSPIQAKSLLSKFYILEDAMSPVAAPPLDPLPDFLNFPELANAGIRRLQEAGMSVVKTTDPVVIPQ